MLGDLIQGVEFTYQLFLCKPIAPHEVISCLSECAYDITLKRQLMNIDELEFTLPYYWNDIDNSKNENFNLVDTGFVILLQAYIDDTLKESQYFHVYQTERFGGEKETKKISCYSLEYKLNKIKIRRFSSDTTGDFVATRMIYNNQIFDPADRTKGGMVDYIIQNKLYDTWSVSYMSPSLSGLYRTFDISEKTVMEVFHEIEQNFNCIFFFDTINRTIQIKDYNDLPNENGLILHDSNYINKIQEKIKIDEIVTRLYVQGEKDATMNEANPTGQDYVDNFNYFRTTKYMSQSLLNALTAYDAKLLSYQTNFSNYQAQLLVKQGEYTDLYQNASTGYYKLETDLLNIQNNEDTIIRTKSPSNPSPTANGHDYAYWYAQENIAKTALSNKQIEINNKQAEINAVINNINGIATELSYNNTSNFTNDQLKELLGFINEDSAKCNSDEASELYSFGKSVLNIKSQPPIEFDIDVIDILNCAEENYTWDKLSLGSKINLIFEDFEIQATPRITAYTHTFDTNSLSLTVSNKTYYNDDLNYITAVIAKSKQISNTVDIERDTYKDYQNYKSDIETYMNSPIDVSAQPIELDQSKVILERRGMFMRSVEGAGGQMRLMDNKIVMSNDNFQTFSTAITSDGVFCNHLWTLTNSGGSVEINDETIDIKDMRLDMTTWNQNNRIVIDPTNGIKIQQKVNQTLSDVFSVDSSGNLIIKGNITMNGGSIDWNVISSDPDIATAQNTANTANNTANTANSTANTANNTANTALTKAQQIADGSYSGGTFINGTTVYSPTILNNKAGLTDNGTTDSDIRFWAGSSFNDRSSAPFRVTQGGAVTCSNLTVTNGSISGSTSINGSSASTVVSNANNSVQQSSLYNNVKISTSDGIQVLDGSNNERVKIGNIGSSIYGIQLKKSNGDIVLQQDSSGNISMAGKLKKTITSDPYFEIGGSFADFYFMRNSSYGWYVYDEGTIGYNFKVRSNGYDSTVMYIYRNEGSGGTYGGELRGNWNFSYATVSGFTVKFA